MSRDPHFAEGVRRFNARDFHGAHDAWEVIWRVERGPERQFYQGLIQVAGAFHHLQRGHHVGFVRLLEQGVARLQPYAPSRLGLAVAPLLVDLATVAAHADDLGPAVVSGFDSALFPTLRFEAAPEESEGR